VEKCIVIHELEENKWMNILLNAVDLPTSQRILKLDWSEIENIYEAKELLRKILEPDFDYTTAISRWQEMKFDPKIMNIDDFIDAWEIARIEAEVEDSIESRQWFLHAMPRRIQQELSKMRIQLAMLSDEIERRDYADMDQLQGYARMLCNEIFKWEKESPKKQTKQRRSLFCTFCKKSGHTEAYCYSKKREQVPKIKDKKYKAKENKPVEVKKAATVTLKEPTPVMEIMESFRPHLKEEYCNTVTKGQVSELRKPVNQARNDLCMSVKVNGIKALAQVDSGATISFMSEDFVINHKIKCIGKPESIILANGKEHKTLGKTELIKLECGKHQIEYAFEIIPMAQSTDIIIGLDLFPKLGIYIGGIPHSNNPEKPIIYDDPLPSFIQDEDRENHERILKALEKEIDTNMETKNLFCSMPEAKVRLEIPKDKAKYIKQYRIADTYVEQVTRQIKEWEETKVIERAPRDTRWNSPILVVPKRENDGTMSKEKIRVCIDPRHWNRFLQDDPYPLPMIDKLFQDLNGSSFISELDLKSAYLQMQIHEEDREFTTFTWNRVKFQFQAVPFGIKTIPARFQRLMDTLLQEFPFAKAYLDNVIVFTKGSLEEHIEHLRRVIKAMTRVNLTLNIGKCKLGSKSIYMLGHHISEKGLMIDKRKLMNINNWERPTTSKGLQHFLGFFNYFRRFIPKYSQITEPLERQRNKKIIQWNEKMIEAWNLVIKLIQNAPIIHYPDPNVTFSIATDASDTGIGVCIFQDVEYEDRIERRYLAFAARALTKGERNYSPTMRECLTLVFALKKYRYWLLSRKVKIYTDHKALTWLYLSEHPSPMMVRWMETLAEFGDMEIIHLPGLDNFLADHLSRIFDKSLEEQKEAIELKAITSLETSSKKEEQPDKEARLKLMEEIHTFGHFGINHMINELKERGHSWKNMKKEVTNFVRACKTCSAHNSIRRGYHPIRSTLARLPMDQIAVDLAGKLRKSKEGYQYIMVVVDVATKYVWLRNLYSKQAKEIAVHLLSIFTEFGVPKIISSDRGIEFINQTMKLLKESFKFEHRVTSSYNPRANGICEREVQTTIRTLKKLIEGHDKDDWHLFIPSVQMALNCKRSARTNSTPFSLMMGRPHNHFADYSQVDVATLSEKELIDHWTQIHKKVYPKIYKQVKRYTKKINRKLDKKNRIVEFKPGDKVYIEIKPTTGSKLDKKWEGPYEVVRKNKGGAYKIKDEEGLLLRRVIPPSQMKLYSREVSSAGGGKCGDQ
jgi:ribosomal protein L21E